MSVRRSPWRCSIAAVVVLACGSSEPVADDETGETGQTEGGTPDGDSTGGSEAGSGGGTFGSGATASTGTTGDTEGDDDCGDGIIQAGEHCDNGEDNGDYGKCNTTCSGPGPHCGDAIVNGPEACDDGNPVGHDTCTNDCVAQACGDGVIEPGELCFAEIVEIMAGIDPTGILADDLDDDGDADLVVLDAESANALVLLGDGRGGFASATVHPAPMTPMRVASGTLDRGTTRDVAVIGDGTLQVLLGDGVGNLIDLGGTAIGANGAVAGDLDGDGVEDLVVTTISGVLFKLATGDGSFVDAQVEPTPGFVADVAAIVDVNGDGPLDAVVAIDADDGTTAGALRVFLGAGDGSMTAMPGDVALADDADTVIPMMIDADGVVDLAVLRRGPCLGGLGSCIAVGPGAHPLYGEITLLRGNGDGTFSELSTEIIGLGPRTMVSGDIDGDGNEDLVVLHAQYRWMTAMLARGDGTFVERTPFDVRFDNEGLALAHLDDDGIADLAYTHRRTATSDGAVRLLLSTP